MRVHVDALKVTFSIFDYIIFPPFESGAGVGGGGECWAATTAKIGFFD